MPMFARRENVSCQTCHTVVPRLNRFGFEYRRAGFRLPDNLGQEEKPFNLGDFFAGRVQATVDEANRRDGPGATTNSVAINFREFTMYPLTGSWGKLFSSMTELSLAPEDFFEIENAYVRANYGRPDCFGHLRAGVFHPFEGYGASDRPVGVSRPLFQQRPASFDQSTFFTPWGFDQVGLEGGFTYRGFSATATVFNGLFVREEDGALQAFAAQGGALAKTVGAPASSYKDLQLFINQLIGEHHGVSAAYYHGWIGLPKDPALSPTPGNLWRNSFDRFTLYGYTQPLAHLGFQAGGLLGVDHRFDPMAGSSDGTFDSAGFFGEALLPINTFAMGALRYDYFDPATSKGNNTVQAGTAALNWYLPLGLQLIGEYRYIDAERGPTKPDRREHTVQLRMIFIL